MKAPNIIYLQVCGDCRIHELAPKFCNTSCDFDDLAEYTWCKDKVWNSDIAYYSEEAVKDALIATSMNTLQPYLPHTRPERGRGE